MKRAWSRKNLWDSLPRPVRRWLGAAVGAVPARYLLGGQFRRTLRMALAAQWWPAERTRAFQVRRLRHICSLALRSPFYRERFKRSGFDPRDIRRPEDIAGLGTIDRRTLNEQLDRMLVTSSRWPWVDEVATAGTSGRPLRFYAPASRSAIEYAYLVASWSRIGYRLGAPLAVFRGRTIGRDADGMHHEYDPLFRHHGYSSFHMSDSQMAEYLQHADRLGRFFLHGYPSTVTVLGRYLQRAGRPALAGLAGVILESEIVYPRQRRMIEAAFGCPVLACYGHSEKLVLAVECEGTAAYHVWPTYGYFELLDDDGRPVSTPGESGEIVATGFVNTVAPFIRYRTGDYATYVADRCDRCGREHVLLTDIRGHRTQESLIAVNGDEISWTAVNMHDDTFARVRQFQFAQDTPGLAVLRIVPADGFGGQDRARIVRNLGHKLNGRIDFDIEIVDAIELTPRGKAVYVEQRIGGPRLNDEADRSCSH